MPTSPPRALSGAGRPHPDGTNAKKRLPAPPASASCMPPAPCRPAYTLPPAQATGVAERKYRQRGKTVPPGSIWAKSPMHASTTRAAESPSTCGLSPDDWCRRTKIPAAWENRPAWVNLGKVPYARIHNEGGRVSQYVRPFTRRLVSPNRNTGSVGKPSRLGHPVSGFFRRATYPRRQYLGISPDIFVSAHKDIAYAIRRALNSH